MTNILREIGEESTITNVELSGGTAFKPKLLQDIKQYQARFNLNLLTHNYFPPPRDSFILNIASVNHRLENAVLILPNEALIGRLN